HTRWPRDWSSDVCSSDLEDQGILVAGDEGVVPQRRRRSGNRPDPSDGGKGGILGRAVEHDGETVRVRQSDRDGKDLRAGREQERSEERRVGKEGRGEVRV